MEPHKLTKRELEVFEKLNLDQRLRRIRENHWGDTAIPPRSPELTKRIEQALTMQIPPSPPIGGDDRGVDRDALEALNAAIMRAGADAKAPYAWKMRIKRCIAHHARALMDKAWARIGHWSK